MAQRKTLTDRMVLKLNPGAKRITLPDPELLGHYIRVTPKGAKSYVAVARTPGGKQIWTTLGSTDHYSIAEAREQAREQIRRVKTGEPMKGLPMSRFSFRVMAGRDPAIH